KGFHSGGLSIKLCVEPGSDFPDGRLCARYINIRLLQNAGHLRSYRMKRIAVVGLGIIGSAWAQNLHADGLEVRGWNRTPKQLPFYEPDLAKAVTDAELIFI